MIVFLCLNGYRKAVLELFVDPIANFAIALQVRELGRERTVVRIRAANIF